MILSRRVALGAALALSAVTALAVRPGEISGTAELVCAFRAIAAQHPDPKLRNPDHLAGKLCNPSFLPRDYAMARREIDRTGAQYAAYFYVNARTRHIDAMLRRAAGEGTAQIVVLGAGFDSRAYRFRNSHPKLQFFEVDLAETIASKKNRLAKIFGAVPNYVRFAPIDFNTQSLEQVLLPLGYDSRIKTFFILEGVTMYVSEAGNNATLRFIKEHSAPGSLVVYDYILRQAIEGNQDGLYGLESAVRGVAQIGEPFVTRWTPREATAFSTRHGLEVLDDLGADELTQRYLLGSDGKPDGKMIDGHRIIDARVP